MPTTQDDDLPDFNSDLDAGGSPLPCGTYEFDVYTMQTYWADNPKMSGDAKMFRLEMKIVEVVNEASKLPTEETKDDMTQPVYNVQPDEVRMWQGKIGPKDKNNKLPYDCAKNAARVKDLIQAVLRFEPGGKLAETAVDADGKTPVDWNQYVKAAIGENNPFEGRPCRVTISRIQTKSKNHMYVPTFAPSSRVKVRETNVLDSL